MGAFVRVGTLRDAIEASYVDCLLTDQSIPHIIESFHDSAYDGMFQTQWGWGCVLAEERHRSAVERALDAARAARASEPDDERALEVEGQSATQPGSDGPDRKGAGMESRVVKHVVLIKFKEGVTAEQLTSLIDGYRALPGRIEAMKGFEWGTDVSVEGLADGFTHCFITTFENVDGRNAYIPHPAHQEYVQRLLPSVERLLVLDFHPHEAAID